MAQRYFKWRNWALNCFTTKLERHALVCQEQNCFLEITFCSFAASSADLSARRIASMLLAVPLSRYDSDFLRAWASVGPHVSTILSEVSMYPLPQILASFPMMCSVSLWTVFVRFVPSIFFERTTGDFEAPINALLQTRSGGVALVLLTPMYMSEPSCLAELKAVLEVHSHRNAFLKLRCVLLGCSKDDILSSPLVNTEFPTLHKFVGLQSVIPIRSIQETAASLSKVVVDAWECTNNHSSQSRPTILGRTRDVSFLALQRVFVKEDLSVFSAVLKLPMALEDVHHAFSKASANDSVTQYKVNKLYEVIIYRGSPAGEEQRRTVQAYERKWGHSDPLEWGDEMKPDLLQLLENMAKPNFDEPLQSRNVVLNFESCDENGNAVTLEGLLLRKVLEPLNVNGHRTVSTSGQRTKAVQGMGGVGKTTALRALCCQQQVRDAYHDGVYFFEFGQDANDEKVIKQLARCVGIFGGRKESKEMKESDMLSEVVEKGAEWLRDKTVLLVCDDLWSIKKNKYGYLEDLKKLLLKAPKSCLVISTRDRNIAECTSDVVEFASLDAEGSKACEILLAGVSDTGFAVDISDKDVEDGILRLLRICAGLPLALAIAGRGLAKSLRDSTSVCNAVRNYCDLIEKDSQRITVEGLENYPGLARVIESSLKQCQEWGMSEEVKKRYGQELHMEDMFKGLCVLEKQMVMPKRALKHVWSTNDSSTSAVMEMLADLNLANRVESGLSTEQEFGLRLHDLVLLRCQQMAGDAHSRWHKRIVDAYREKLRDKNYEDGEQTEKIQAWWRADDDGYIFAHLSRHLVLSGWAPELLSLLCDIRWTLLRMKVGGWVALDMDFERLLGVHKHAGRGMRQVREVLKKCLPYARERPNLFAFYIFAHLSPKERNEWPVSGLVRSIHRHFPKPWLEPVRQYIGASDKRENWRVPLRFGNMVFPTGLTVNWEKGRVLIANGKEIVVWCTMRQQIFRKLLSDNAKCTASSADLKLIVSGCQGKVVQRLNGESRSPIGGPLRGHEGEVTCIALSADKKTIVSGSADKTVRLWYAESGSSICDALRGHEGEVNCVAVSANGKVVVSGSDDKTVRLWNGTSGLPVCDSLRGHEGSVTCIAVSSDGKIIVSGSTDKTVRLWNGESGLSIGDPLCGHQATVRCVSVTVDGKLVVSGSHDKTIRRWDAERGSPIGDPLFVNEGIVALVAVSADGSRAVSVTTDKTVREWNLEECNYQAKPNSLKSNIDKELGHYDFAICCAVSADRKVIVTGSVDKTVQLWNGKTGLPIGKAFREHQAIVRCVAVSADGKLVVSGSDDGILWFLNGKSGLPIRGTHRGQFDQVTCVAANADGTVVVTGSADKTIQLWNGESGTPISDVLYVGEGIVRCVAVSADGNVIAFGSEDARTFGGITLVMEGRMEDKKRRRVNSTSRSTVGDYKIYSATNAKCIAMRADGKLVVAGSKTGEVQRWDLESRSLSHDRLCEYEGEEVKCVAVSADGKVVTSGSHGKVIRLTDEGTRPCTHSSMSGQFRRSVLNDISYFANDMFSVATDLDGLLFVIGCRSGQVIICRWVD